MGSIASYASKTYQSIGSIIQKEIAATDKTESMRKVILCTRGTLHFINRFIYRHFKRDPEWTKRFVEPLETAGNVLVVFSKTFLTQSKLIASISSVKETWYEKALSGVQCARYHCEAANHIQMWQRGNGTKIGTDLYSQKTRDKIHFARNLFTFSACALGAYINFRNIRSATFAAKIGKDKLKAWLSLSYDVMKGVSVVVDLISDHERKKIKNESHQGKAKFADRWKYVFHAHEYLQGALSAVGWAQIINDNR